MKMLISSLVITLAVFLNFDESDATKRKGEELSSTSRKSRMKKPPNLEGLTHRTVFYNKVLPIDVWMDPKGSGTRVVYADYFGNIIPTGYNYSNGRFVTRVVYVADVKLVEYLRENGSLMGIRPPNLKASRNRRDFEPDDSTWYITYDGSNFRVRGNSATGQPNAINLLPKNLHEAEEFQHGVIREEAHMLTVHFLIVRGELTNQILGAELDPAHRHG